MGGNIVEGGCAALNNNWRNAAVSGAHATGIPLAEAPGLGRESRSFLFTGEGAKGGRTACVEKRAANTKGK